MNNSRWIHFLHLHFIVFLWGFTGVLGDLISVSSFQLVWYRMLFAGLFMWVLGAFWKAQSLKKDLRWKVPLTGLVVGLHWICFYSAIKVSSVSVALASFSCTSLFTSMLEPIFFKRKISFLEYGSGLLVMVAMVIIFNAELDQWLGIVLGISAAFTASLFTVLNGLWAKRAEGVTISAVEMSSGFIALSLYMFFIPEQIFPDFNLSGSDWFYLTILSLVCTVYTFVASIRLMKHFRPFDLSLAVNMEPIYGILLALLFLGKKELMSSGFYVGAGMVMATVFLTGYLKTRYLNKKI